MGAGLLQLVLSSQHDQFITQNPQISYFKYSYKRHTAFSNESIRLQFSNNTNLSTTKQNTCNCEIGRYGDLLSNVYFGFTLPAIYSTNKHRFRWVENVGNVIIKRATVTIGGVEIDSLTGEWMNIWNELTLKDENSSKILGNTSELINPTLLQPRISVTNNRFSYIFYPEAIYNNGDSPSINEKTIYTPLNFWFTRNPSLALPLLKLQFSEININIELETSEVLYQVYSTILEIYISPKYYNQLHGEKINITNFCSNSSSNEDVPIKAFIEANYIFLDTNERNSLLLLPNIKYLVEQISFTQELGIKSILTKSINNNSPTKEIIWTLKRDDYLDFNYHNNYTATYEFNEQFKILEKASIKWNRSNLRVEEKDADFYSYVQPYQYHSKIPKMGIYCYSFSLFPEKLQPSGTFNGSQVKTEISVTVNNKYNNDFINNKLSLKYLPLKEREISYILDIYTIGYNVFEIISGAAGMKFTI